MTPTMTGLRPMRSERTPMRGPQTMAAAVRRERWTPCMTLPHA